MSRTENTASRKFWATEEKANQNYEGNTSDIPYIKIDFDKLPKPADNDSNELKSLYKALVELSSKPIANLSMYSNTELRLKYGTKNFEELTEADSNYTIFVRKLNSWCRLLLEMGQNEKLRIVTEYAFSLGVYTSELFISAAKSYIPDGNTTAVTELIHLARDKKPNNPKLYAKLNDVLSSCYISDFHIPE